MTILEIKEWFSVLSPIILAVMGYVFNRRLNKQKEQLEIRDKESEEKNKEREEKLQKLVLDKLNDVEVKLVNLEFSVNSHIKDTDFRSEFKDSIRNKSRQILLNLSNFLTQDHKNILSNWADSMEKFGLDFYYTSKRQDRRKDLDNFLTQLMDTSIGNFYNYIDYSYEEVRISKKKKMLFSQFVDSSKVHNKTEQLKMRLVVNGFEDTKEVIDLFSGYIEDFFMDFTNVITLWERLEIYEKEVA